MQGTYNNGAAGIQIHHHGVLTTTPQPCMHQRFSPIQHEALLSPDPGSSGDGGAGKNVLTMACMSFSQVE